MLMQCIAASAFIVGAWGTMVGRVKFPAGNSNIWTNDRDFSGRFQRAVVILSIRLPGQYMDAPVCFKREV